LIKKLIIEKLILSQFAPVSSGIVGCRYLFRR
jgi:hypothetical protein